MENQESSILQTETSIINEVKWYTPLFKITLLSKCLAMAIFIVLPFLSFWLGLEWNEKLIPEPEIIFYDTEPVSGSEKVAESPIEVVDSCSVGSRSGRLSCLVHVLREGEASFDTIVTQPKLYYFNFYGHDNIEYDFGKLSVEKEKYSDAINVNSENIGGIYAFDKSQLEEMRDAEGGILDGKKINFATVNSEKQTLNLFLSTSVDENGMESWFIYSIDINSQEIIDSIVIHGVVPEQTTLSSDRTYLHHTLSNYNKCSIVQGEYTEEFMIDLIKPEVILRHGRCAG